MQTDWFFSDQISTDGVYPNYGYPSQVAEDGRFYPHVLHPLLQWPYYIRVDKAGYGKVYYIFSEFLDDFLDDSGENGLIAGNFTEFLEMIRFPTEDQWCFIC